MAVKLSFNTKEIAALNNDVSSTGEAIDVLLSNIVAACNTLDNYIDSKEIQNVLQSVIEKIGVMKVSINTNIENLSSYLSSQLVGYENLVEEASRMLVSALNFINENFKPTTQV